MAWIETVPDDRWKDHDGLADLYGRVVDATFDRVDRIMAVHSLNPRGLAAHDGLYRSAMSGTGTLRKVERELVALVVSLENHCHYWVTHHRRGLRRLLKNNDLLAAIEADWTTAPLAPSRRAMLDYAVKLTRTPGDMERADVDALRAAGFSDRDVLDLAEVTAYYAYANRIADGLGITTEDWIPED